MANTLAEYYQSIGKALPSVSERSTVAAQYGITNYTGSAEQNTALLGKLQGGSSAPTPTTTPSTSGNLADKNAVQSYTNNIQNQTFNNLESSSGPSLNFSPSDLAAALVAKGGYNQTDANNASTGPRATELAKEFLGISGGSGGSSGVVVSNGNDGVPTVTADTLKGFLPTESAPAPIDRNALLEKYRTDQGVAPLEASLNDLKAQQDEALAASRALTNTEKGKAVPLGVMDTRISVEQQAANDNLEFIQRQISRVTDQLTTSYNIINTYVQNDALDYQDAVKAYDTKFDQGITLFSTLWGVTKDQWTMQQQQKATAQTNLGLYVNAVTSGNMNYSSLSSDQKLQISKLETQAGLPTGFISALKMSPKDQIAFTNTNEGVTQVGFIDPITQQITVKTYGKSTAKISATDKLASALSGMEQKLAELGGSDGLVSAQEYKAQKSIWIQAGFPADDFDSNFRGSHVDESHPADYGLKPYSGSDSTADELIKLKAAGVIK